MGRGRKVVDERHYLSRFRGGGIIGREIWEGVDGRVTYYNLAYINSLLHAGDNGRVLGYDNAHGNHHRHYLGAVTLVSLKSFAQIEKRFESELQAIREGKINATIH